MALSFVNLTHMDSNTIISQTKSKMQKAIDVLKDDFGTVKTGKANPQLVENVIITTYGGSAKLKILELATISVSDPQTIVITPFDQSVTGDIERGITDSQMGLGVAVNGNIIRVTIPQLTEERRVEFVKLVHKKAENGKVMIRQVRADSNDHIKKLKEEGHISEDEVERLEKEVQKATDSSVERIDEITKEKEKELMTV